MGGDDLNNIWKEGWRYLEMVKELFSRTYGQSFSIFCSMLFILLEFTHFFVFPRQEMKQLVSELDEEKRIRLSLQVSRNQYTENTVELFTYAN